MAASIRSQLSQLFFREKHPLFTILVRGSRYDTSYVENTRTIEAINEPLEEGDPRSLRKIKAARTDDTTFSDFDPLLQKFTNLLMRKGEKHVAREIIANTFESIKRIQVEKYHKADPTTRETIVIDPLVLFHQAIENGKPLLYTTKVVSSGVTYQVPRACPPKRQEFLSMKWLIEASKEKERRVRFYERLSQEIVDASNYQGRLIKKKQELHRLCEANKSYASYKFR